MKRIIYALALLAGCSLGSISALPASATATTLIGKHDAWKSYFFLDKNKKVCFMSSQPEKQAGKFKKRGEVSFFVTHWSGSKDKNVVSIANGYSFKPDSHVIVTLDHKTFNLFTQGEMAWTEDQAMDDALTLALQKGTELIVQGTSVHGTKTTDTYSLKGSGAAYKSVVKACAN